MGRRDLQRLFLIDIPLWDRAQWRAAAFDWGASSESIPAVGLVFLNGPAGAEIFKQWRAFLGPEDEHELIRLSIIEGDIPGKEPGYTIHIGPNSDRWIEHAREQGVDIDKQTAQVLTLGRILRLNPNGESPSLRKFKEAYRRKKEFLLVPSGMSSTGPVLHRELAIHKRELFLRRTEEIDTSSRTDVDMVVFPKK